jgi:Protein of unknown function (DUF1553)/Protein of unknown function (DUF1549)/Concanavalin A-like lectin/glucanases superfamily/Planctomycete cytochrome C
LKPRLLVVLLASASLAGTSPVSTLGETQAAPAAGAPTKPVDFNREVRPILSDNCFKCHGPDEKMRMAKMRLDETEGLFVDRGGYKIIVPGNSAQSKLYQKISAKDAGFRMPPTYSGKTLTEKQVETIKQWIDQGAKWETQWSFVAPKRPAIPEVKDKEWVRNPIDSFVLARLETEGLKPSEEADKATLLRRASFDLTGLPPTPAEVDSFVADKSPDAYEKRVDRMLASPHYGERMAMEWLDLARYSDTHGYHIDSLRAMWPWRDWVIKAYNQNMPYDQFTVKQLAGDLLPNATLDDKIATGFNRNNMINFEGGAVPQEYHAEYIIDRASTTATVWLGLTMGCARCHDHKFDPIRQKDFYQMVAYFNTIPERGLDGFLGNADPVLPLPTAAQQHQLDDLNGKLASTLAALPEKDILAQRNEWQKTALAGMSEPSSEGLIAYYPLENSLADASGQHHDGKAVRGDLVYDEGKVGRAAEFSGETQVSFGNLGDFDRSDRFAVALWARTSPASAMKFVQKRDSSEHWQGYEIFIDDPTYNRPQRGRFHFVVRLAAKWPDNAIEVRTKDRFLTGTFPHLVVNYDGSGKASGVRFYVNGKPAEAEVLKDNLTASFRTTAPLEIGNKANGKAFEGELDDLRIYDRPVTAEEAETLGIRMPVRSVLTELAGKPATEIVALQPEKPPAEAEIGAEDKAETPAAKATRLEAEHQAALSEYYLKYAAPEKDRRLYAQLVSLREQKSKLQDSVTSVMVMAEMKKPRDTFILGRGQYDNPRDKVNPGVPAFLPPLRPGAPANRLALAQWLIDPKNPLTARVAVNRYWQDCFGTGIVKTAEDFGSQGEQPSHPQLLDWLATEFISSGWDIKAMMRLIVTSATYRQSSHETKEMADRDPENRLLARGPRFRLPAEMVRDNALDVAGLLDRRIGGPSVYPYQPKGLWEEMAFGGGFSAQTYTPSTGEDLYRRSMYTTWKRTVPPPSLTTFDAPDREKCTARRTLTNTPLQALVLLNDPTYVEASRVLAEKTISQAGHDPEKRVDFAFRLVTDREPQPQERAVLLTLAREELAEYRRDKPSALKLIGVGEAKRNPKLDPAELAAWTTVTSTILNMDETITKE